MNNFITNSSAKDLKKRLLDLLAKSKELKFLVGFFYFSGLKELYEGLKKNPDVILKVLVGLNADRTLYGIIEHGGDHKGLSDEEKLHKFFLSLKNSINTDQFDNKEFYEQAKFFIELIKSDRLIIRKTFEPNHAKLYIFKLQQTQVAREALFITGSSNLTYFGLTHQQEFNVEISDYGLEEAEKYFDDLWEMAIPITEDDITKKRLIEFLEKETLIKEITPYEAYALVLKTYLDSFRGKEIGQRLIEVFEEQGYKRYKYQLDAIKQALSIIEQNNGVIIADVVGLGKTVIACAVAFELNKRGIVIAPPGLIGDETGTEGWNKYLEDFHLTNSGWKAFSLGRLEEVAEYVSRVKDIEVVIVDEAHRFRNQDTRDYELLKNICRNKIVLALTATPFNNKPADIFSLLKLFITPKKSTITLTDNLELKFTEYKSIFDKLAYIKRYVNSNDSKKREKAEIYYKKLFNNKKIDLSDVIKYSHNLARQIKNTIEPVTIRRNRLDLQNNPFYSDEVKELSKLEDPRESFFELTKEQSKFYDKVIDKYFALPDANSKQKESKEGMFKGAIYRPFLYKIGIDNYKSEISDSFERKENFQYIQQFNLYDLMRRLLVKRFESSFGAFKQSLENFKEITDKVLSFIQKTGKYILDRQLLEKIHDKDLDEIEEALKKYAESITRGEYPKNHEVYEINKLKDKERFLADIASDRKLFEDILRELEDLDLVNNDPKAKKLIEVIQESQKVDKKRKIVIFSEYIDTVKYLAPILQQEFNNRVLVIAGDLTKSKTTQIYANFDASYPEQKQEDEYDILLTTDKISEGFNLNRAGMVINYDIPWNPVRVIQRVGRINRISKKVFDSLYIVNFFPTEKGADFVKSKEIAENKMFLIHNALGEDAKIFGIDEVPTPSGLYKRILQNPEELEEESFYTKVLKEFEEIKSQNPEIIKSLENFPPRIKVAKKSDKDELFVFIKKGRLFIHCKDMQDKNQTAIQLNLEDVKDRILPSFPHEPALPLSNHFWDEYEKIKKPSKQTPSPKPEQSLEQRAINILKTLLSYSIKPDNSNNFQNSDIVFIKMLLEDILEYGTLSDFTLRRIANIEPNNISSALKEIAFIKSEIGEDYLQKEIEKLKQVEKEIIIAIENRCV
ncbi:MAG: helicase-related protein [Leptonema sp. (in: bacteria)]